MFPSAPRLCLCSSRFAAAACSREAALFNDTNALAHVSMLAGTIGSRPVGTPANARAREYIVDQLRQIGFDVRVQETDARRHELGRTARVANIIGILPGEKPDAIGLVSHYDSSPDAPGASDDGLGVAVTLEAARVLAAGGRRQWTLLALITDGEESGLMGAAGLVTDREVMNRLRAYLNLESIGSSGTAVLFETGPANALAGVAVGAPRAAPARRLVRHRSLPAAAERHGLLDPQDPRDPGTEFRGGRRQLRLPHRPRYAGAAVAARRCSTTGENVVAIVTRAAADRHHRANAGDWPTFFDIGGTVAVTYGPSVMRMRRCLALVAGVIGWVRVSGDARAIERRAGAGS